MQNLAINIEGYETYIFFGGFIALFAAIAGVGWLFKQGRLKAIERFAARKSWDFNRKGSQFAAARSVPEFALFKKGGMSRIKGVAYGREAGLDVAIGDYRYQSTNTGSDNSSSDISRTFCIIGMPGEAGRQSLPDFALDPEHVGHLIFDLVGFTDIDFNDSPAFSKAYRLTGDDEESVRAFFTPAVIEYFENHQDSERHIEARGRWVMLSRQGRVRVSKWDDLYNETLAVTEALTQTRG